MKVSNLDTQFSNFQQIWRPFYQILAKTLALLVMELDVPFLFQDECSGLIYMHHQDQYTDSAQNCPI